MTRIIVECKGSGRVSVFCSDPAAKVGLIDHFLDVLDPPRDDKDRQLLAAGKAENCRLREEVVRDKLAEVF